LLQCYVRKLSSQAFTHAKTRVLTRSGCSDVAPERSRSRGKDWVSDMEEGSGSVLGLGSSPALSCPRSLLISVSLFSQGHRFFSQRFKKKRNPPGRESGVKLCTGVAGR